MDLLIFQGFMAFRFFQWKSCTSCEAFHKLPSGSHVTSDTGYPSHFTKYCSLDLCIHEFSTCSTSHSELSSFLISGGGLAGLSWGRSLDGV